MSRGQKSSTLNDIAEKLVIRSIPEPNSGCYLWEGTVDRTGYGIISYEAKGHPAHRMSWLINRGKIPAGLCVLHRCDVRCCTNPDHLFLGTHTDNMRDMSAKGRGGKVKGVDHPRARLKPEIVLAIRAASGTQKEIAALFNVPMGTVSHIKAGTTWKHL